MLFIGLWIFFIRQMQSGGGKAMSFGKSKARMLTENETRVTFADVAGIEESKIELEEIIEFLREPKKFTRLGGRIPKGVLLVGPPVTGKTLLARAVAGETQLSPKIRQGPTRGPNLPPRQILSRFRTDNSPSLAHVGAKPLGEYCCAPREARSTRCQERKARQVLFG